MIIIINEYPAQRFVVRKRMALKQGKNDNSATHHFDLVQIGNLLMLKKQKIKLYSGLITVSEDLHDICFHTTICVCKSANQNSFHNDGPLSALLKPAFFRKKLFLMLRPMKSGSAFSPRWNFGIFFRISQSLFLITFLNQATTRGPSPPMCASCSLSLS